MRAKEIKLIITFASTTKAMEMEQLCKKLDISGRLIPIPRNISAGCGLVWCMDLNKKNELQKLQGVLIIDDTQVKESLV